jgi:hypothetical protein
MEFAEEPRETDIQCNWLVEESIWQASADPGFSCLVLGDFATRDSAGRPHHHMPHLDLMMPRALEIFIELSMAWVQNWETS